jgi:hypothetical protein
MPFKRITDYEDVPCKVCTRKKDTDNSPKGKCSITNPLCEDLTWDECRYDDEEKHHEN